MAFTWLLGKRSKPVDGTAEDKVHPPCDQAKASGLTDLPDPPAADQQAGPETVSFDDVILMIEDGLVMAFGPEGDPLPPEFLMPELLKEACSEQAAALRLSSGEAVDHQRLAAVLKAQQSGPLADRPSDRWVQAMLGVKGGFEDASSECLAREADADSDEPPCRPSEDQRPVQLHPLRDGTGTAVDMDHATVVMVTGMPAGWSLTAGLKNEDGSWTLDPADFSRASVRIAVDEEPANPATSATLIIDVISVVGHDGTLAKETRTLTLPPDANRAAKIAAGIDDQPGDGDGGASLFTEAEIGKIATADAVLIRGVPEGARLSAGAYDPKIRGWVLRPALLQKLVIEGLDDETGAIEIELTAVRLDEEGGSHAEVVVSKSVQPAGSFPKNAS